MIKEKLITQTIGGQVRLQTHFRVLVSSPPKYVLRSVSKMSSRYG